MNTVLGIIIAYLIITFIVSILDWLFGRNILRNHFKETGIFLWVLILPFLLLIFILAKPLSNALSKYADRARKL